MIGQAIKGFSIVARVGRGGMGEVWAAEQPLIGTRVAIKLLSPEASADASQVERFFHEAVAASKIKHAGIVHIHDVGFHDGRAFLIMELLEGESLAARFRRIGALPIAEVLDIGRQLGSVLSATHAAGIVHRDLKPDNVFVVPDHELPRGERAKVLDFGIAKLSGRQLAHTAEGGSMGTPPYMAPEQWTDASTAGARADVYSLGCLLFEIACGRPPFIASSVGEACTKHLTETPPLARSFAPDLPAELEELIHCMLAKAPDARPTMQAVTTVLARLGGAPTNPGYGVATPPALDRTLPSTDTRPTDQDPQRTRATASGADASTFDKASASLAGEPPKSRRSTWLFAGGLGAIVIAGTVAFVATRTTDEAPPLVQPKLGLDALAQFHAPTPRSVTNLHSVSMWTAARDDFADACKQPGAPARWCAAREFADGEIAMNRPDAVAATAAYKRAIAADPTWADAEVGLATAVSYQHDLAGALDAAHLAQRLDPSWWIAVAVGARAYSAAHKTEEMIQEYRRALSLAPHDAVLLSEVALAYHNANMDAEADRYGDAALAIDDSLVAVHLLRAERALEKHDGKVALAEADRVLAVSPANGAAHLARGDALALLDDKAGAFGEYKRTLELASSNSPDARLRIVREAMEHDRLPPPRGAPAVASPTATTTGAAGNTIGNNTRANPTSGVGANHASVDPDPLNTGGLGGARSNTSNGIGSGGGGRANTSGSGSIGPHPSTKRPPPDHEPQQRSNPGCPTGDPMCSGN